MPRPAPSRVAAALDYLERLKSQATEFGGGVAGNLADRARSVGGLAYEALTSDPNIGRMTTAEFSEAASRPTPRLDQAAQDFGTIGKAIVTQPIQTGQAIVQGEIDRAQEATTSPRAAGEYAGSFIDPMRIAAALRKGGTMRRDIFTGESAKTWNQKEADRALAMEAYGVDPETIWQETGTFRGADKKWRQEISDAEAKGVYTHIAPSEQRLSQVALEHPELLEAYPDIAKIQQFGLKGPRERGSYQTTVMKTVDGSPRLLGEMVMTEAPNEDMLTHVAIHEMQHAIQQREGFQRGANPRDLKNKAIPAKLKDVVFKRAMQEMAISNKMRELGYPITEGKGLNLSLPDVQKKVQEYGEKDPNLLLLLGEYRQASEKLKKYPNRFEQYTRSAGETEARAVQTRQMMSPEERRATFPFKSYDIPLDELILSKK